MLSKRYRLSYLPLFYEELDEKVTYIAEKLKNPKAANDLWQIISAVQSWRGCRRPIPPCSRRDGL